MRAFVCFEEFADLPAEEAALLAAQAAKERGSTVRAYPMSFAKGFTEFYRKKFGGKILPTKYTDANRFLKNGAYGVGEDYGVLSVGDLLPIEDTLIKDPLCGTSYGLGCYFSISVFLNKIAISHIVLIRAFKTITILILLDSSTITTAILEDTLELRTISKTNDTFAIRLSSLEGSLNGIATLLS